MKRDQLRELGIADDAIDKILGWNMDDIGKEKRKTEAAQDELKKAQDALKTAQTDLEALKTSNGDIAAVQKQLTELQAKYDTDTGELKKQLSDRDYTDAINKHISSANEGKGLKFSSKSAQTAFVAALREKGLELKDGAITGFDDFVKAQREADPDAFAPDSPPPRFATGSGSGSGGHGNPNQTMTTAELMAQNIGKAAAESGKTANNIISMYTGGNKNGA